MVEYIIPIKGLALGNHEYSYKIDSSFFNSFEYLEIENGILQLDLELVKESTLLNLMFRFKGWIDLQCDRCLDNYRMDIEKDFRLIVKYADKHEEISDEIITIPSKESNFDIHQLIYEYINLMLPIKKAHPDDEEGNLTCNPEMVKRLNEYSEPTADPRWDALKNIKLD